MRVTAENIETINHICDNHRSLNNSKMLLSNLLDDVNDINKHINDVLYIDYIDEHTNYSSERTDPCPDYYGHFYIRSEKFPCETLGVEMTLNDLDNAICVLANYVLLNSEEKNLNNV